MEKAAQKVFSPSKTATAADSMRHGRVRHRCKYRDAKWQNCIMSAENVTSIRDKVIKKGRKSCAASTGSALSTKEEAGSPFYGQFRVTYSFTRSEYSEDHLSSAVYFPLYWHHWDIWLNPEVTTRLGSQVYWSQALCADPSTCCCSPRCHCWTSCRCNSHRSEQILSSSNCYESADTVVRKWRHILEKTGLVRHVVVLENFPSLPLELLYPLFLLLGSIYITLLQKPWTEGEKNVHIYDRWSGQQCSPGA